MKTNTKSLFCIFITMLFLSTGEVKAIEQTRYNMNDITRPGNISDTYTQQVPVVIVSDRKEMRIETPCTATTYPPVPEDEDQQ